jgi:hypothetical protein
MTMSFASPRPSLALAAALTSILTACQVPLLKQQAPPPAVVSDKACAADCDLSKSQCEKRQTQREQEYQDHIQQVGASQNGCTSGSGRHCLTPVGSLGADMGICRTQHEECLQSCADHFKPAVATRPSQTQPTPAAVPSAKTNTLP